MSNSLLSDRDKPVAFISVSDRIRVKNFYMGKLGLKVLYEDEFAPVMDLGVTSLRISELETYQPQQFTVLGWEVTDIVLSAKKLMSLNIEPKKRHDVLQQDELGIWCSPSTSIRVVWFEDPDGNLLSISDPLC